MQMTSYSYTNIILITKRFCECLKNGDDDVKRRHVTTFLQNSQKKGQCPLIHKEVFYLKRPSIGRCDGKVQRSSNFFRYLLILNFSTKVFVSFFTKGAIKKHELISSLCGRAFFIFIF